MRQACLPFIEYPPWAYVASYWILELHVPPAAVEERELPSRETNYGETGPVAQSPAVPLRPGASTTCCRRLVRIHMRSVPQTMCTSVGME